MPTYVPLEDVVVREYIKGRVPEHLIDTYMEKSHELDALLLKLERGIYELKSP